MFRSFTIRRCTWLRWVASAFIVMLAVPAAAQTAASTDQIGIGFSY